MTARIRPPKAADIPDLIAMVDELNVHEGEPTGHMTPERAMRDVIGDEAAIRALLAETDGLPIGFAFWHPAYETPYAARGAFVTDLYVREAHRGGGVGEALLQAVARASAAMGGEFLWLTSQSRNERARRFYNRLMNVEQERIVAYALTGERFQDFIGEKA